MCLRCGLFLMFDDTRIEGLRLPTPQENAEIRSDPVCQKLYQAWTKVTGKHSFT